MIYNLYLNSKIYHPSTVSATNRGQRIYAIDWSFLPDNTKFKVKFRFLNTKLTATSDFIYLVQCNLGQDTTYTGATAIAAYSNYIIGFIHPRAGSSDTTDLQLSALYHENSEVYLNHKPINNLLEIKLIENTGGQWNIGNDYMLILSFETI